MPTDLRYALVDQVHFLATDPEDPARDVVVTLQRWHAKTGPTQVYVRCHNGTEFDRRVAASAPAHDLIDQTFTLARTDFAEYLLSETAAGDQVAQRGGPSPKYCHVTDCGTQVPYGAGQCADGHPSNHTNAGTYVVGASRRPTLTVLRGGRR